MFDAIIFDFDGVIINSEPIHYEACFYVLNGIGYKLTFEEYMEKWLGLADKEVFPKLLKDKGYDFTSPQITKLINEKIKRYNYIINNCENLPLIPGVIQFIANAITLNKKIAICSAAAKSEIFAVLNKLTPENFHLNFDAIISSNDVITNKPSPEGYLLAAKRLGMDVSNCLVIEDSPHGIDAAKSAGMYVIGLLTSHEESQLLKADKITKDFTTLACT